MDFSPSPVRARGHRIGIGIPRRRPAMESVDESMSMLMDTTIALPLLANSHQSFIKPTTQSSDDSLAFNQLHEDDLAELAFKEEEERERKRKERRHFLKDRELEKAKQQKWAGKENQPQQTEVEQTQIQSVSKSKGKGKENGIGMGLEKDAVEVEMTRSRESQVELSPSPQTKSPSKNKTRRRREECGAENVHLVDVLNPIKLGWGAQSAESLGTNANAFNAVKKHEKVDPSLSTTTLAADSKPKSSSAKFESLPPEKEEEKKKEKEEKGKLPRKSKLESRLPRKSSFVHPVEESNQVQSSQIHEDDIKSKVEQVTSRSANATSSSKTKIPTSMTSPTKPSFKSKPISTSNRTASSGSKPVSSVVEHLPEENLKQSEVAELAKVPEVIIESSKPSENASQPSQDQQVKVIDPKLQQESQIFFQKENKTSSTPILSHHSQKSNSNSNSSHQVAESLDSQRSSSSSKLPPPTSNRSTSKPNRRVVSATQTSSSSVDVPVGFRKTSIGSLVPDPKAFVRPFSFTNTLSASTSTKPSKSNENESKNGNGNGNGNGNKKVGGYKANQVPEWIKLRKQKLEIEREFKLKNQLEMIRNNKESKNNLSKPMKDPKIISKTNKPTKIHAFNLSGEQRSLERKEFERLRDENLKILEMAREEMKKENEKKEEEIMKKERERTIIRANEIPLSSRRILKKESEGM